LTHLHFISERLATYYDGCRLPALFTTARLVHGTLLQRPRQGPVRGGAVFFLAGALERSFSALEPGESEPPPPAADPAGREREPIRWPQDLAEQVAERLLHLDLTAISCDLFAPLYETAVASGERKGKGVFFTPPQLVDAVIYAANVLSSEGMTGEGCLLDPAAGTGAFIVRLMALARRWRRRDGLSVLSHLVPRLYAVESAPSASALLKINMAIQWAAAAALSGTESGWKRGCRPPAFSVAAGDALLSYSLPGEGGELLVDEKAAAYGPLFVAIAGKNDFRWVIGNPPYVGESGHRELFAAYRRHRFWRHYSESKMNFLQYFLVLGLHKLAAEGGTLGFVTSSYWLTAEGAAKTRDVLLSGAYIEQVISFHRFSPFPNVPKLHNAIVILKTGCPPGHRHTVKLVELEGNSHIPLSCRIAAAAHGGGWGARQVEIPYHPERLVGRPWHLLGAREDAPFLDRLDELPQLRLFYLTRQGVAPGAQKVTRKNLEFLGPEWVEAQRITLNEGIFVLTTAEVKALHLPPAEQRFLKPFIKNSHIKPYYITEAGLWLIYLHHEEVEAADCPHLLLHLQRFKPLLTRKREYKSGRRQWFHLHWPREEGIFTGEKVVTSQRGKSPAFAYHAGPLYAATDVYYVLLPPPGEGGTSPPLSLKALTMVLNSTFAGFWFAHRAKAKGEQKEFFATALAAFPLPEMESLAAHREEIRHLEQAYPDMSADRGERAREIREKTDDLVYALYELKPEERRTVAAFKDK